tara:strand:+ start:1095 stop:1433 length:339 start_codon:yes stop_codon:yes gene_type:complete
MFRVKYESGKYSRLIGKGKTEEEAVANLESKKLQKGIKDSFNEFTAQELNAVARALECHLGNDEVYLKECLESGDMDNELLGYKSEDAIWNTILRLYRLSDMVKKLEEDNID